MRFDGSNEGLSVRLATMDDLEDIVDVAQRGFPDDPEFPYRFPHRQKFPEDNRRWLRQEYSEYLRQPGRYAVVVATSKDQASKPIALSVWLLAVAIPHQGIDLLGHASPNPDDPEDEAQTCRRDVDVAHFNAFKSAMDAGFDQYFTKHGDSQVHLWLLCTDPAFRGRGAGTMLCQWGLDRAAREGLPVTVLASPMGRRLYQRLGFVLDGSFIVQAEGDAEWLRIWALTYPAERPVPGGILPAWLTSLFPQGMMRFISYNLWSN